MLTRMVSVSWPHDSPALASQSAGITGVSRRYQLPRDSWLCWSQFRFTWIRWKAMEAPASIIFQIPLSFFFFFWDRASLLPPRLEYGNALSAYCNLCFPGSSSSLASPIGMCHHSWKSFVFLVEMGFHHVDHADLKLLTSSDLPASASQSAGITGVNLNTQPYLYIYF